MRAKVLVGMNQMLGYKHKLTAINVGDVDWAQNPVAAAMLFLLWMKKAKLLSYISVQLIFKLNLQALIPEISALIRPFAMHRPQMQKPSIKKSGKRQPKQILVM